MIKFDFFVEFIDYLSFGFCNVLQTLWVIIIIIVVVFYFVSASHKLKVKLGAREPMDKRLLRRKYIKQKHILRF